MSPEEQMHELVTQSIRTDVAVNNLTTLVKDHEGRIRWMERILSYGSGAGFIIYFIASKYLGA